MGKEYEEWSGEILSCSLRVWASSQSYKAIKSYKSYKSCKAIKFLKWLIYDTYGRTSKFFRRDGLLLFRIVMGLRCARFASA